MLQVAAVEQVQQPAQHDQLAPGLLGTAISKRFSERSLHDTRGIHRLAVEEHETAERACGHRGACIDGTPIPYSLLARVAGVTTYTR